MEEIRKTNLSDLTTAKVESHNVLIRISDNFDAMETLTTYEGDMPRYDDEIAITGIMCKSYHKKIGDTVTVTAEGRTQEYYITGIFQTMNNNGYLAILPLKGFKKLSPQYEIKQIDIYLNEGVNKEALKEKLQTIYKVAVNEDELSDNNKDNTSTTEFGKYSEAAKVADKKIAKLLADYGVKSVSYTVMLDGKIILSGDSSAYKINEITDEKGYASGQLKSYASMMSGLVTVIAGITFLIIGGILSITIKSLIRKKREEYGIYKAMGYTTKDLVFQLSISFVITSILGTIIGIIATVFLSNKVLKLLFVILGITRLTLAINIPALIILGACMVIYLYLIALVKAYKIKKITAYYLLTE
jgi:putative ABC transport system permease protein